MLALLIVVRQPLREHVVNDDVLRTRDRLARVCAALLIDVPQGHAEMARPSFFRRLGPALANPLLGAMFQHDCPMGAWPIQS